MNYRVDAMMRELANLGWRGFQAVNSRIPESRSPAPSWALGPLPKSHERTKPPLGWPRETDSLCPRCVIETRDSILRGERDVSELVNGHVGQIKAHIREEGGHLVIRKECREHGVFEDLLSLDPEFSRVIEKRYPGRNFRTPGDERVHRHGTSSVLYERGTVLTVDLTNRCNMMCDPCFMDADQVGYVHELKMNDIREILDASVSFMTVQFSGGEPTMSPHFLEACAYAKKVGYFNVRAATNGQRFALEPEFAFQAKEAGLDLAYLKFDSVPNEGGSHRHISDPFDGKRRAIEVMRAAGIQILPVTTIVNGVNDSQVGPILDFSIANCDALDGISFQPVSFTGRDEEVTDEERRARRYTISHLAQALGKHTGGKIDPYRDWFPLGTMGAFGALAEHLRSLRGPDEHPLGAVSFSCHPNCESSVVLVANTKTKEWATITQFFDLARFMDDIAVISHSARGKEIRVAQIAMSFMRNYDASKAPPGFSLLEFVKLFFNGEFRGTTGQESKEQGWRILWVGGMWFQDLWTYDFRRAETCVVPYGTQEGEISLCAYNTGVGWRQIVEDMHSVASTKEFETRGRHRIHTGNRPIPLALGRRLPITDEDGRAPL